MGHGSALTSAPDPTVFPNSSICLIEDLIPGVGVFRGSGVIIGPHTVLTAAHVLWDADSATGASEARISVGGSSVIGGRMTFHYNHVGDYSDELSRAGSARDFGIIDTRRNLTAFGTFGVATDFAGGPVNISGYPANRGTRQIETQGSVSAGDNADVLNYDGFTLAAGYSGGPVWVTDGTGADPAVAGLVSTTGWACRLTSSDMARITRWAAADGDPIGGTAARSEVSRAGGSASSNLHADAAAFITGVSTNGSAPVTRLDDALPALDLTAAHLAAKSASHDDPLGTAASHAPLRPHEPLPGF